ncbi:hypothetical protein Tco_1308817, partial [Tanacetum coccineum]
MKIERIAKVDLLVYGVGFVMKVMGLFIGAEVEVRGMVNSVNSSKGRKIPEYPWGSPIPIGDGDRDVKRFPDRDGDGDGDEAHKRGWG